MIDSNTVLTLLTVLEIIVVGILGWGLKTLIANGKTLVYVKTKLDVVCARITDHEGRLREHEKSHR